MSAGSTSRTGIQFLRRSMAVAALLLLAAGVLGGCGRAEHADLSAFVARVRAEKAPPIEPMPTIARYVPYTYDPDGRRTPFSLPAPAERANPNSVHPNLARPLDPLEQFPLDALSLVGTLSIRGTTYALVRAPDGVVHRIAPGEHLGRNYGEVTHVGADGVTLDEIVPDGNDGYVKRRAVLVFATDRRSSTR